MLARQQVSQCAFGRVFWLACVLGWLAVSNVALQSKAANREPTVVPASTRVRSVLQDEARGTPVNREKSLEESRSSSEPDAEAYWHSGWVKSGKSWFPSDKYVADKALGATMAAYSAERAKLESHPNADAELAEWCHRHDLPDQQRIHWMRVLETDPNHSLARARLGFENIDGRWYSAEEIRSAREQTNDVKQRLLKWMPILKDLIADSKSKDSKRRAEAIRKISGLSEPDAIPALEVATSQVDDTLAVRLVQAIAKNRMPESAAALARIAVVDAYGPAGDAAAQALREMPMEYYVPELLRNLSSPISQQFELYESGYGILAARQLLFRETKDRAEAQQLDNVIALDQRARDVTIRATFSINGRYVRFGEKSTTPVARPTPPGELVANAARNLLIQESRDQKTKVDQINAQIEDTDQRIFGVLSTSTRAQVPADPNAWWQWWYGQNELYVPSQKPVQQSYQQKGYYIPQLVTQPVVTPVFQMSCLVAGTLVRTVHGLRSVETIQPGDMVLAQRIDSGELAYKPVLRTTVRPPAAIVRIQTENDTIRATGGHLFWVSGKGWMRARKLEPGMQLHTVRGTVQVDSVSSEEEEQPAFNLIVPDFHTYFVGAGDVLSYDNTPLQPTAQKVPGLSESAL